MQLVPYIPGMDEVPVQPVQKGMDKRLERNEVAREATKTIVLALLVEKRPRDMRAWKRANIDSPWNDDDDALKLYLEVLQDECGIMHHCTVVGGCEFCRERGNIQDAAPTSWHTAAAAQKRKRE